MWKAKEFEHLHAVTEFLNAQGLTSSQFKVAAASGNTICRLSVIYWEEEKKPKGQVGFIQGRSDG